jgi:antimicrobial peptide system SdpB family protein
VIDQTEESVLDLDPSDSRRKLEEHLPTSDIGVAHGIAIAFFSLSGLSLLLFNSPATLFPKFSPDIAPRAPLPTRISLFDIVDYGWAGHVISSAVLLLALTGKWPRWVALPFWWVVYSAFVSGVVVEGGEQICAVFALLLLPLSVVDNRKSRYLSLPIDSSSDAGWRHRLAAFSVFLVQAQVSLVYAHSAISKLGRESWQEGTAVFYFLQDTVFGPPQWLRPTLDWIMRFEWGSPILSWGAVGVELYLGASPWLSDVRSRRFALYVAVVFHSLIAVVFGLPSFFLAAVGMNVLALNIWENRTVTGFSFPRVFRRN